MEKMHQQIDSVIMMKMKMMIMRMMINKIKKRRKKIFANSMSVFVFLFY